jgi:hypothetical protein
MIETLQLLELPTLCTSKLPIRLQMPVYRPRQQALHNVVGKTPDHKEAEEACLATIGDSRGDGR